MTVHLACSSRKETPPRRSQARPNGTAIPQCYGRHGTPVLYYDPVPRAANFWYRGTQLWMTDDQAGRCRYADGSQRMPQDCRVASWTPKFVTAHSSRCRPHTCLSLHNLMVHQILDLNFGKGFKHSTHRAHKVNSAITLGCANCFGCECNVLLSTLPLRHTIKMLLHLETVPNDKHCNSQRSTTYPKSSI